MFQILGPWKFLPQPWLGGWVDWSVIPYTKRLWVRFLVRARSWVVGSVPTWGAYRRQPVCFCLTEMFLSLSLSLSPPLYPAASLLSKIHKRILG